MKTDTVFNSCRSVGEIGDKIAEFQFKVGSTQVVCLVCKATFTFEVEDIQEYDN